MGTVSSSKYVDVDWPKYKSPKKGISLPKGTKYSKFDKQIKEPYLELIKKIGTYQKDQEFSVAKKIFQAYATFMTTCEDYANRANVKAQELWIDIRSKVSKSPLEDQATAEFLDAKVVTIEKLQNNVRKLIELISIDKLVSSVPDSLVDLYSEDLSDFDGKIREPYIKLSKNMKAYVASPLDPPISKESIITEYDLFVDACNQYLGKLKAFVRQREIDIKEFKHKGGPSSNPHNRTLDDCENCIKLLENRESIINKLLNDVNALKVRSGIAEQLLDGALSSLGPISADGVTSGQKEIFQTILKNVRLVAESDPEKAIAKLATLAESTDFAKLTQATDFGNYEEVKSALLSICSKNRDLFNKILEDNIVLESAKCMDITSFFREKTMSTMLISAVINQDVQSREFADSLIKATLGASLSLDVTPEVRPASLYDLLKEDDDFPLINSESPQQYKNWKPDRSAREAFDRVWKDNISKLTALVEDVYWSIIEAGTPPDQVCRTCKSVINSVMRQFGVTKGEKEYYRQIGGIVFLRYLNPTIMAMTELTECTPASKNLITNISLTIQNVSNYKQFSSKFPLSFLNPWVAKQQGSFESYIDQIIDRADEIADEPSTGEFIDDEPKDAFSAVPQKPTKGVRKAGDVFQLPDGFGEIKSFKLGNASGAGNNCLIYSIIGALLGEGRAPNDGLVGRVRTLLDQKKPENEGEFLTNDQDVIEDILTSVGENKDNVNVFFARDGGATIDNVTYNKAGPKTIYIHNSRNVHFSPLFKVED